MKGNIMDLINIVDFQKLDIRVAEIKTVEEIPGADKLYKITADLGDGLRTLAAGIKLHYKPEELVGKKVIVLKNLEPRTVRGIESNGMILAASNEDRSQIIVLTVDKDILPGAKIS
jgi:methionine--tRNA ligase beta chain